MAQWLRTPVALSEDPGLVPSLYMVAYSYLFQGILHPLLLSSGTSHACGTHAHMHTHTHTTWGFTG